MKETSLFDSLLEEPQTPSGPVICLGMTVENDEARRVHFTEELRKKLADLGSEVSDKAARTPAALQRQIETDVVLWRRVLKEAGIEAN